MIKLKDEYKYLFGLGIRSFYNAIKSDLKTDENESAFDFFESIGKEIRNELENNPKYQKIYQGADLARKAKEFADELEKLFSDFF